MKMSVEAVWAKLSIKIIPKFIGEPNYKVINELREALYVNAASIPTMIWREGGAIFTLAY